MSIYEQVRNQFWPHGDSRRDIWAVLDCARDSSAARFVMHSGSESECLFAGELDPDLRLASPFLIRVEFDDRKSIRMIEESWGASWGIFLKADLGVKTLRRHLRTLLRVRDPQGKFLLFRYYDPRVLRVYVPECTAAELAVFTGPVAKWWAEDCLEGDGTGPSRMLCFDASIAGDVRKSSFVCRQDV